MERSYYSTSLPVYSTYPALSTGLHITQFRYPHGQINLHLPLRISHELVSASQPRRRLSISFGVLALRHETIPSNTKTNGKTGNSHANAREAGDLHFQAKTGAKATDAIPNMKTLIMLPRPRS